MVAQRLQIAIEHCQIGAHAESDPRRVCSGNATADDQDARRGPSVVADVFFGDVVVARMRDWRTLRIFCCWVSFIASL